MALEEFDSDDRSSEQRKKYEDGAASSPTPPPWPSFKRDRQTLEILRNIEPDCLSTSSSLLVKRLAENFLYEQSLVARPKLKSILRCKDDLIESLQRAIDSDNLKEVSRINRRLKCISKLDRAKRLGNEVRVYGWDKTTPLLKSAFYAWSLEPAHARAFTVMLTPAVEAAARNARIGLASHLQSRLSKLLRRRLGLEAPSFWFALESGVGIDPHLHGGIAFGGGAEAREATVEALHVLAGDKEPSFVKVSEAGPQGGWAAYAQKHSLITAELLDGKTIAATRSVKSRARKLYGEFQAHYKSILRAS